MEVPGYGEIEGRNTFSKVIIDRPVLTQAEIDSKNSSVKSDREDSKTSRFRAWREQHTCEPKEALLSIFPILAWLPNYKWRSVTCDITSGFVVAVLNLPQGMAYAMLGNLPPVVGIYMAFYPVLAYAILGTSRHISIGTLSVVCLMSGKAALDYQNRHHSSSDHQYSVMEITTAITFAAGIWQALLGLLRLGAFSVLLNSELVSGFTTGAAVHVLTSQIQSLLGLKIPTKRTGLFKIILSYVDVWNDIANVNVAAIIISIVASSILAIYNELLKPCWSKKISIPLPIELIIIIIGTVVSYYFRFEDAYGIDVVSHIPIGLPTPDLPKFELIDQVFFPDALLISIVAYAVAVSMAKIFANKRDYVIDANQELLAHSGSNFVGSFFGCAPVSASLSRSILQEQVGGLTQLASIFSCGFLAIVLLWIGPLFEPLPNCVLSSIIAVSLKSMFMQVTDMFSAWKLSKLNAVVWLSTFLASVVLDIEYGLGVGVTVSALGLLWRSNRSNIIVLGVLEGTGLYVDFESNVQAKELPGLKIVKYHGNLNFANAESFTEQLIGIVPLGKQKQGSKDKAPKISELPTVASTETILEDSISTNAESNVSDEGNIRWIILDMATVSILDPQGAKIFKALVKKYADRTISILLAGCTDPVLEMMKNCEVLNVIGVHRVFPTVHDAVIYTGEGRQLNIVPNCSIIPNNCDVICDQPENTNESLSNDHARESSKM